MAKFRNKYRIESTRLKGWDYRNAGFYFITICIRDRRHLFGECKDGKMKLSTIGAIVQGFWYEIPRHFDHVRLGEYITMPNHIHGILILDDNRTNKTSTDVASTDVVSTRLHPNLSPKDPKTKSQFFREISPKAGTVSTILGIYKSVCTKHIMQIFPNINFEWQERFHDHIIRNDESFVRISNYIINNPLKWKEDKFYNDKEETE